MDEVILVVFFLPAVTTYVLLDCLKFVPFRVYELEDSAFPCGDFLEILWLS